MTSDLNVYIFSKRIKALREERGWTREGMADKLDCSNGIVTHWEGAEKAPGFKMLGKISLLFNVSVDYLMGFSDERSPRGLKKTTERENS